MDDDKAMMRNHVVMGEVPCDPWLFDGQAMTDREKAIYHDAFKKGQRDLMHRIMDVVPSNCIYRRRNT